MIQTTDISWFREAFAHLSCSVMLFHNTPTVTEPLWTKNNLAWPLFTLRQPRKFSVAVHCQYCVNNVPKLISRYVHQVELGFHRHWHPFRIICQLLPYILFECGPLPPSHLLNLHIKIHGQCKGICPPPLKWMCVNLFDRDSSLSAYYKCLPQLHQFILRIRLYQSVAIPYWTILHCSWIAEHCVLPGYQEKISQSPVNRSNFIKAVTFRIEPNCTCSW